MRVLSRWLKRLAIVVAVLVALAAIPIVYIETQCMQAPRQSAAPYQSILQPPWKRNLADTYLTYPEWSIVHAYEDFAAVARTRGEADFAYLPSITGYWSRLCQVSRVASARAPVATDVKAMLYVIGLSFSGEMAVKGAYETTIGRFTAWLRGPTLTAEDQFTLRVNDEYALFLRQTPWYEFPFADVLKLFWAQTPMSGEHMIRKIERRVGMTMEWGVKAIYAKLIAQAAALAPADLRIRSAINGLTDDDVAAEPRISIVERRADGSAVIETPRYRAFTDILLGLAARGRDVIEIAGQQEIFVTAIAPDAWTPPAPAQSLFAAPLQARAGYARRGLVLPVPALAGFMREAAQAGVAVEHVYDY